MYRKLYIPISCTVRLFVLATDWIGWRQENRLDQRIDNRPKQQ